MCCGELWSRMVSRNTWNKAACSRKVDKGLTFGAVLFGSAPLLQIVWKQTQVSLYEAIHTITA